MLAGRMTSDTHNNLTIDLWKDEDLEDR